MNAKHSGNYGTFFRCIYCWTLLLYEQVTTTKPLTLGGRDKQVISVCLLSFLSNLNIRSGPSHMIWTQRQKQIWTKVCLADQPTALLPSQTGSCGRMAAVYHPHIYIYISKTSDPTVLMDCEDYKILYHWKGQPFSLLPFRGDVMCTWVVKWQDVIIRHALHVLQNGGFQQALWKKKNAAGLQFGEHKLKISKDYYFLNGRGPGWFVSHN